MARKGPGDEDDDTKGAKFEDDIDTLYGDEEEDEDDE